MKRFTAIAALMLIFALVLSGCGGDPGTTKAPATQSQTNSGKQESTNANQQTSSTAAQQENNSQEEIPNIPGLTIPEP